MRNIFVVICIFSVLVFAACAKKVSSTKAPAEKITSYNADVLPLIQARCTPCHLPTKGGNKASFENYVSASKYAVDMLDRVQKEKTVRGFMPFKGEKLSAEEITVFKKWVDGGVKEN